MSERHLRRMGLANFLPLAVLLLIVLVFAGQCPGATGGGETATIEGTWAGVVNHTYYCESGPDTIQLDIAGATITITGGTTFTIDTTGTIAQQAGQAQAFNVTLDDGGDVSGQLFVDPAINYAVLVIYDGPVPGANEGFVGVLQKGTLTGVTYQESDLVGNWEGIAVRVDANFEVTESSASSATITQPGGLILNGTDGDGSFSAGDPGIILEAGLESAGIYVSGWGVANQVVWPGPSNYDALYALSSDKTVLAVGFLTSVCDSSIFADLPSQKFAIWVRQ